jgi:hypothetical protein
MGNSSSSKKRSSFRNDKPSNGGSTSTYVSSDHTSTAPKSEPVTKDELNALFDKYQAVDSHDGESEKARDYIGVSKK